jgi:hypothetical protein
MIDDCKVGAGIFIDGRERMEQTVHLGNYAEVQDAELTGIRKSVENYKLSPEKNKGAWRYGFSPTTRPRLEDAGNLVYNPYSASNLCSIIWWPQASQLANGGQGT